MAEVYLIRATLFLLPFALEWLWRWAERRRGRPGRKTPWATLVVVGSSLVIASLFVEALLPRGVDHGRYVPANTRSDGTVKPGHFEAR